MQVEGYAKAEKNVLDMAISSSQTCTASAKAGLEIVRTTILALTYKVQLLLGDVPRPDGPAIAPVIY